MNQTIHEYGLVGFPLGHSFSRQYFTQKFSQLALVNHSYHNIEIQDISHIRETVKNRANLRGFNVTVPHKVSILPFLDEINAEAGEIGAVNTVTVKRNGHEIYLTGYNTDVTGFEKSIKPFLHFNHHRALVLGTGGASKAVVYVLKKLGVQVVMVSRHPVNESICNYTQLNKTLIQSHLLIVNTTPLGMYPTVETFPEIPYEYLTPEHLLVDLVYNPEETVFLKKGKEKGALILNGLSMLHLQAEKSFEIWNEELKIKN